MRVLVTGATGFIGHYVIQQLLERQVDVVATSASLSKAKEKSWFAQVRFVEHDIHKTHSDENLFEKFYRPDLAIHLAWGGLSDFKSQTHITEVLPGHSAFLKNLIQNGLNDLTVTGTCLEYGMQEGALSEEMESRPAIAYPIAKDMLRKELEALKEIKVVRCIRGAVFDVIVDLRSGSPTFLHHIGVELSEQNKKMLYIPEGFAHGFQTLADDTELVYLHSEYFTPNADAGVGYNDPALNIQWPLPVSVISEKDKHLSPINHTFKGI